MTNPGPRIPDIDPLQALAAVAASAFKAGGAYERLFGVHSDGSTRSADNAGTDLGKFLDRAVQEGPAIMMGLVGTVSDMLSPDRPTSPLAPPAPPMPPVPPVPSSRPADQPSPSVAEATSAATDEPPLWSALFPAAQPAQSAPPSADWAGTHPLPWNVHVIVPQLVVDANGTAVGMMDTSGTAAMIVAVVNVGAVNAGGLT